MLKRVLWPVLAILVLGHLAAAAETLHIGQFSRFEAGQDLPTDWEQLTFHNIERQTEYSQVDDQGRTVIRATSEAAASGLIHHYSGPAGKFPWLVWSWKIAHVLKKGDVSSKQGDDYAARIYVAFEFTSADKNLWQRMRYKVANFMSGGDLPGSALNYVWANKEAPQGTIVNSPYTAQSKMILLQSGDQLAGQWLTEKRDIVADYQAAFGRKAPPIIGIALMTDTDNTGEATSAYYGDILLTDDPDTLP